MQSKLALAHIVLHNIEAMLNHSITLQTTEYDQATWDNFTDETKIGSSSNVFINVFYYW